LRRRMIGGGVGMVVLVALAALFLADSSPRAQSSSDSWCQTRRFQIVSGQNETLMIDGDTGDTWRLGQIGSGDKKESGWVFLPRENPRSPK
jgi:hypothetical protein